MKKLLALFVLLTALAVMATACSSPQDQITPANDLLNNTTNDAGNLMIYDTFDF